MIVIKIQRDESPAQSKQWWRGRDQQHLTPGTSRPCMTSEQKCVALEPGIDVIKVPNSDNLSGGKMWDASCLCRFLWSHDDTPPGPGVGWVGRRAGEFEL